LRQPHPLGPGWEGEFDREWDRIFKPDSPDARIPRQKRTAYPFKLEDIVRKAMVDLRKELGKAWLPNRLYGTRLHAAVHRRLAMVTPASGWEIHAEEPLHAIGGLSPRLLRLSVRSFLDVEGQRLDWLRPHVSGQLDSRIGDIKPDLFIRAPDGAVTIWDLTSREQQEHLAKTVLYANLLTSDNQLAHIGETYWLKFR
jgi:hypothetical protein